MDEETNDAASNPDAEEHLPTGTEITVEEGDVPSDPADE
jgi:hypothetical protein